MATAPAPSFWSQPIAATRAHFVNLTTLQAVEFTFGSTIAMTLAYLWWRGDVFGAQVFTGLYLVAANLLGILRARLERPGQSVRGFWIVTGLGAAVRGRGGDGVRVAGSRLPVSRRGRSYYSLMKT